MLSLFREFARRKIERRIKLYQSRGWIPYEYRLCDSPSPDSRETRERDDYAIVIGEFHFGRVDRKEGE